MSTSLHEITLDTLAYGGDCIGRLADGRTVFVPFGLPGERVRIRLTQERRGFARGELVEVLEPSEKRITPLCKHYRQCGGCHYQHLPYELQLVAKADILRDQLQRIGKIENPPVRPMVASASPWHYRNHVQFHLTREGKIGYVRAGRMEPDASGRVHGGLGAAVVPITECHLPEDPINSFWPQLDFEPDTGVERVSIRTGMGEELMLVLESDSPDTPELEIEAGISVVHLFEEHAVVLGGADHIFIRVLNREFQVSAASFFQVNRPMAGKMVEHLLAQLHLDGALLLDLYCGVGLFSAFLAARCRHLIGVEVSESACEDFAVNLDDFENVDLYQDLAENVLPALKIKPDIILLDPPRAGVEKAALDSLIQMSPGVIAYVSCDPSTLSRDAARLSQAGYRLREVTPFDLFPQTYHIESISFFEK